MFNKRHRLPKHAGGRTLVVVLLIALVMGCDLSPSAPLTPSQPLVNEAGSPTSELTSLTGSMAERKLLTVQTTRGTMLIEVYPMAAPALVAAFSQHYKSLVGKNWWAGGAASKFMTDQGKSIAADHLLPLTPNDLPYRRGSMVLPFDRKRQVSTGNFAILTWDVPKTDRTYDHYKSPLFDEYPGYVVVGQMVSGFELLDGFDREEQVTEITLTDPPAAAATLAAVPATPTYANDYIVTQVLTFTDGAGKQMVAHLYGVEAPEAVAAFVSNYAGFDEGKMSDSGDVVQVFSKYEQRLFPNVANKLPQRRGSLILPRISGGGGIDSTRLLLAKYDLGATDYVVIGQIVAGVELLDAVGRNEGGFFDANSNRISSVALEMLRPVPTLTPLPTAGAGANLYQFGFITKRDLIVTLHFLYPFEGDLEDVAEQMYLYSGLSFDLVVDESQVSLVGSPSIQLPVLIKPNNMPYQRGSVVACAADTRDYLASKLLLLKRDLSASEIEAGCYVVGAVSSDLAVLDRLEDGEQINNISHGIGPRQEP